MCRFIGYLGRQGRVLGDVLVAPSNSLMQQSKAAKESGKTGLNADGFGVCWYNHSIDNIPAVFRSTQPAWNDPNFPSISSKVASTCFLAHVRAATVGDVSLFNCHPFTFNEYSMVHNGTIRHFEIIRKDVVELIGDDLFTNIKGQTDSEHFFALVMHFIQHESKTGVSALASGLNRAVQTVQDMQKVRNHSCLSRINVALTDGKNMVIMRYISDTDEVPVSLYYRPTDEGYFVSSEPLSTTNKTWEEVDLNSLLLIDDQLNVTKQLVETN